MLAAARSRWAARHARSRAALLVAVVAALLAALVAAPPTARAAATGQVSGTVTDSAGTALAGIRVDVYLTQSSGSLSQVTSATTSSSGTWSVTGLTAGVYRFGFTDPTQAHVTQYWKGQGNPFAATDVTVTDATPVTGIDAHLAPAGRIVGRVTDASGATLAGISVSATNRDPASTAPGMGVSTTTDGTYVLAGLEPGAYTVSFRDPTGRHAVQWFDGADAQAAASAVVVSAGNDQRADAQLAQASHVTGHVTDSASGLPVSGIYVTAVSTDPMTGNDVFAGSGQTGADGNYDVGGLVAGAYRLQFDDFQRKRYISEAWNDKPDISQADPIVVGSATTTANIDAALDPGSSITGAVTGVAGLSLTQVYVVAYQQVGTNWNPVTVGYVNPDGTYLLGPLRPGTYRLDFGDYGGNYAPQWWNNKPTLAKATDIMVKSSGPTTGIDVAMKPAAHITGRVTDAQGVGLAGVSINAYPTGGSLTGAFATSGADGTYDLGGLAGGSYKVRFDDRSEVHLGTYWMDTGDQQNATPVTAKAGRTVTGVDEQLATASSVSGTVVGDDGRPVAGAHVFAEALAGTLTGEWGSFADATTDQNGAYTLTGLAAGRFMIQFAPTGGRYLPGFYDSRPTQETADPVTIGAAASVQVKPDVLTTASHLTGTVTDTSGRPVVNAYVSARAYSQEDHEWEYVASAQTDSAGAYDVGGLKADTYRLEFGGQGYAQQFWNNKATLATADGIKVGARKVVSSKNARLQPEGQIQGTVLDRRGAPVANLNVQALTLDPSDGSWDYAGGAVSDQAGRYTIHGLATYTYRVAFEPFGDSGQPYATQYWNRRPDVGSATDVPVTAGSTATGVDGRLDPQSTISGTVTDTAGHAVDARVDVYRRGDDGAFVPLPAASTYSYDDPTAPGHYTVSALPAGTYRLQFTPYDEGLTGEFWNDAPTLAAATDIVVTKPGLKVTGKDAVLAGTPTGTPAATAAATAPAAVGQPDPFAVDRPSVQTGARAIVVGRPTVGSTLIAALPIPTGTRAQPQETYRWLVGGVPVPGAVGPTYDVSAGDVGESISVETTPGGPGSTTGPTPTTSWLVSAGTAPVTASR